MVGGYEILYKFALLFREIMIVKNVQLILLLLSYLNVNKCSINYIDLLNSSYTLH